MLLYYPSSLSLFSLAKNKCDLLIQAVGDFLQVLNFNLFTRDEIVGDVSARRDRRTTIARISETTETQTVDSTTSEDGTQPSEHILWIGQEPLTSLEEKSASFINAKDRSSSESEIIIDRKDVHEPSDALKTEKKSRNVKDFKEKKRQYEEEIKVTSDVKKRTVVSERKHVSFPGKEDMKKVKELPKRYYKFTADKEVEYIPEKQKK